MGYNLIFFLVILFDEIISYIVVNFDINILKFIKYKNKVIIGVLFNDILEIIYKNNENINIKFINIHN